MKQCPQCHRVYEPEQFFCLEDGAKLTDARDPSSAGPRTVHLSSPPGPGVPTKTNPALWVLLGLAAVVILVFVVREISGDRNKRPQTTTVRRTPASTSPVLVSTPESPPAAQSSEQTPVTADDSSSATRIVVPETLELDTNRWKAYPFTVGDEGGRVTGEYAAKGGIADNMRVIIIADSEFEPFRNNYPFRSYHDTGKTSGGSLNVPLPAGDYYLLIVNPSPWTSRRIRAPISLENN